MRKDNPQQIDQKVLSYLQGIDGNMTVQQYQDEVPGELKLDRSAALDSLNRLVNQGEIFPKSTSTLNASWDNVFLVVLSEKNPEEDRKQ